MNTTELEPPADMEKAKVALEGAGDARKAAEAKRLKDEAAAAKKAAAAPDVEKLRAFAGAMLAMSLPRLVNESANSLLGGARTAFADAIERLAEMLEGTP